MWPKCQCGRPAKVYAMDPLPDGWADYYCYVCKPSGWITDILGLFVAAEFGLTPRTAQALIWIIVRGSAA